METKIVVKEVTKNRQNRGWKVYINGSKYPKKPVDFYRLSEAQAVMQAQEDYRKIRERAGKAIITDSCEHPVHFKSYSGANVPQTIKVIQTDRLFVDSPDAGDPVCLCSRCGLAIPDGAGIIRAWPEQGEGEYRYHPECLGAIS